MKKFTAVHENPRNARERVVRRRWEEKLNQLSSMNVNNPKKNDVIVRALNSVIKLSTSLIS
jgi:hypothetical protein